MANLTNNIQIKKVSQEGIIANNMIFYFCDLLETFIPIAEFEFNQVGLGLDKRTKSLLNQIKWASHDLRKRTTETHLESQLNFGEEADIIKKLILVMIDRTGENNRIAEHFIKYMESFPSMYKLKLKKFGV